jgi:holo-[acyl-carrier protein] synthase
MIYGVGADLVEPARVGRLLAKYGERFARRVLTPAEWASFQSSPRPDQYLAGRFAAKEAFSKALGTGLRGPVSMRAISVVQDRLGKPSLSFTPELEELVRCRGICNHHLTLTDEHSLACAFVVLEKS